MKAGPQCVLEKTYRAEGAVIEHLETIIERHRAEHDVRHVSIDLVQLSRVDQKRLASTAAQRQVDLTGAHHSHCSARRIARTGPPGGT